MGIKSHIKASNKCDSPMKTNNLCGISWETQKISPNICKNIYVDKMWKQWYSLGDEESQLCVENCLELADSINFMSAAVCNLIFYKKYIRYVHTDPCFILHLYHKLI